MPSKNITILIVVLVIFGAVFFYFLSQQKPENSALTLTNTGGQSNSQLNPANPTPEQRVVTVTANSVSPSSLTIKAGESITWVNTDSAPHQISSDPHPAHTNYPLLNTVGLISSGEQQSLTFPTPGTYGYHDHLNPQLKGAIIVQ